MWGFVWYIFGLATGIGVGLVVGVSSARIKQKDIQLLKAMQQMKA